MSGDGVLLRCEDLSVLYGKKIRALSGVSLEVRSGEIVVLIGANGSGKSTLLKTVSGLLHAEKGRVLFDGEPVQNLPAHGIAARGVAHVPEGRRIFSRLTVRENLELGCYRSPREFPSRLEQAYGLFPLLKEREGQPGGTLSGGEQQMLAIARALMSAPKLLMLDEPSMGLAPIMVERIFATIQRISASGTTLLLVEQNARQSLGIAHRGYVLETGRIVLQGPGPDLLHDPTVCAAYLGTA